MSSKVLLLLFLAISSCFMFCNAGYKGYPKYKIKKNTLKDHFYRKTCPNLEEIVQTVIERHVLGNPNLPAKLIRMQFHDCFVRGCDASILLNSTADNRSEKEALPNLSISGFEVIDEIKEEVEKECKRVVSCADILAIATRDAVSFPHGRQLWKVRTGRRDGTISLVSEATANIPSPFSNFTVLKHQFQMNGLSVRDLVVLSGAHTIGRGHCNIILNRLFNFTGKGDQDPSLNPAYADFLRTKCNGGPTDRTTTVELDPDSSFSFDSHYFEILKDGKGLFTSDATLLTNERAKHIVFELIDPETFLDEFAVSMEKMIEIGVLTSPKQGQIRKHCSIIN
ncbi:peroxidase 56-like [Amaranthus tricolor]|uniref:peroxidase 56-like n=1 Tax=Amaranthus tricolor TaxID=29722 RepID=UPI002586118E|nr:peroxidase 56-like [Amaranthus tricolor]